MTFHALDLAGRAAMLGITCRELVAIGQRDRRVFASPSLKAPGSVAWLKRWLVEHQPIADMSRLSYAGDHDVRAQVRAVLGSVPAPVAWLGVEFVTWVSVRPAQGWSGLSPASVRPQMVALCAEGDDASLQAIIAHELAHSWARGPAVAPSDTAPLTRHEWIAMNMVSSKLKNEPAELFVRRQVDNEVLADELATLWGFDRRAFIDRPALTRRFTDEQSAAAELADHIEHELEGAA